MNKNDTDRYARMLGFTDDAAPRRAPVFGQWRQEQLANYAVGKDVTILQMDGPPLRVTVVAIEGSKFDAIAIAEAADGRRVRIDPFDSAWDWDA